jgi:hypothetical protein
MGCQLEQENSHAQNITGMLALPDSQAHEKLLFLMCFK